MRHFVLPCTPVRSLHVKHIQFCGTSVASDMYMWLTNCCERLGSADSEKATDYESWNFKDVCRCCVDYNSISEAFKHLPSEGKSRILIREGMFSFILVSNSKWHITGTYRESIKIEFPVEVIGIGRVEKIVVENLNPTNLLTIDTKDSKYLCFIHTSANTNFDWARLQKSFSVVKNLTLNQAGSKA